MPVLSDEQCRACAQELLRAPGERRLAAPPSRAYPHMTIADAYRIQDLWTEAREAGGARVIGRKVGLTSRAMQVAYAMTEPDYGRILDDAVHGDGARIRAATFFKPRVEVELAFVLGTALAGPGVRMYDAVRAAEFVVPALEVIDHRAESSRAVVDMIADNAAFGAIVVGGRAIRPMDADIRWIGATLSKNGLIEESGVSASVMGHPAAAVAWLANALAAVGARLEPGQIVLSGSFTRPVDVVEGDVIHADYGPLGSIGLSFV
jgi:2-oxo-hept-3-ene-1,7-dioate hydratase